MARKRGNRTVKPIYEDCIFEDSEGKIFNDGLQSGLAQREKMSITGAVVKADLDGDVYSEHTNQAQGSSF